MYRFVLLLSALVTVSVALPGTAQPGPRLINSQIDPEWIDAHRCWYRLEHHDGTSEFILVDAETGTRKPLFDHALMALRLSERLGRDVAPGRLPIDHLQSSARGFRLLISGGPGLLFAEHEQLQMRDATAEELRDIGRPLTTNPGNSRNGGPETQLLIHNAGTQVIQCVWRDSSGQERSYGNIAPGATFQQHTFAGHVWLLRLQSGETLGGIRAERGTNVIYLDGTVASPPRRPEARANPARDVAGGNRYSASIREYNIILHDRDTGNEHRLTTDGSADDRYENRFYFSPDQEYLVALKRRSGGDRRVHYIEAAPRDQLQPKLHSYHYLKPGDRIPQTFPVLFNLKERNAVPLDRTLFENPWSISDFAWLPDSSRFLFTYNQRGHQVMRVLSIDPVSAEVSAIIREEPDTFVDYSNKYFRHDLLDTKEIIWMSERSGWNHLYLLDASTGEVKNPITTGHWVVRGVDHVDHDARTITFRAMGIHPEQDPYHVHTARIGFDGSNLTILTEGDGTHELTASPGGEYFIDRYSRVDLPPVTELRRAHDGHFIATLAKAEVVNSEAASATGRSHRPPTRFVAKGRDGQTDIWGIIHWPRDFDAERSYPVIESIYAGPHGAHVPKSFRLRYGQNELTDRGFIVVQIDGMGTNWRSKAFHDHCWKNIGDAGFPDRIAWITAAANEFGPAFDLTRVGIYGGSAGGQNAMRALIAHNDFYHVAVADCGCHDNRMDKIWWNEAWMGYPVGPEYEASSNVVHAHRMEGKLLLIVGEKDENVDPASTLQVVDALIRADKDFDFLLIPGAGHGAAESSYGRRRRLDFFVEHLLKDSQ